MLRQSQLLKLLLVALFFLVLQGRVASSFCLTPKIDFRVAGSQGPDHAKARSSSLLRQSTVTTSSTVASNGISVGETVQDLASNITDRVDRLANFTIDAVVDPLDASVADPVVSPESDKTNFTFMPRWKKRMHHFIRDSGLGRTLVDASVYIGLPAITKQYPKALVDFLHLSGVRRKQIERVPFVNNMSPTLDTDIDLKIKQYGTNSRQVLHIMQDVGKSTATAANSTLLFVHGGAWGSGFPAMYRLVALPFLQKFDKVVILGYRTYPSSKVKGQVDDVVEAVKYLQRHGNANITLMGHSAGAHLSFMAALQHNLGISRLVALSGVYCIPSHYKFEYERGVQRISPMAPACGGNVKAWKQHSPTHLLQQQQQQQHDLPLMLIAHGREDTTVCCASSEKLAESIRTLGDEDRKCTLQIWDNIEHAQVVFELMFGGYSRDRILDWIDETS